MRLVSLLMVAALALGGCGTGGPPPSAPSAKLNKPLPTLRRAALDGTMVSTGEPSGKVTVVKFFAKYCKPCRKTLPGAQRLHEENGDVAFIGIDLDEQQAEATEMVQSYRLSFPVIHDPANLLAETFQVERLPTTFVADASGVIRWVGGERQTEEDLEAAIAWVKRGAR